MFYKKSIINLQKRIPKCQFSPPPFRYLLLLLTLFATTLQASCDTTATRRVQGSTATVANVCEHNLTSFVTSCAVDERTKQGTTNVCEALPNVTNNINILYTECIAGKAPNQGYMDACPLDRATISLGVNNHQALENLEVGEVVGYVAMVHMGDDSAILSFSLSDSEFFEVNASGAIKLKKALDYETTAEYNLSLTVTNGAGISRREALNIEVLDVPANAPLLVEPTPITEFTYSEDANWTEDNDTYYTPTGSWKNEDIDDDQSACMEARVNEDENTSVLFAYKVSSEKGWDFLEFYIDDDNNGTFDGNIDWTKTSYYLSSGEHTLKWCYSKDGSVSSGDDTAWVDDIALGKKDYMILPENTPFGQIGIVEIVPQDDASIDSFTIDGNGSEKFEVDTDGRLSLVEKLDYEMKKSYFLSITAHNLAGDSNTVTITITVTDVDDLYITNAFYDNNATEDDTTDDKLLLQYSKPLDEASIQDPVADNYTINQNETIDSSASSTAEYNSTKTYYHHTISLVDPTTLKEQNISITTGTLTDLAGVDADSTKTLIRATTGSKVVKKTGQVRSYDESGESYHQFNIKDDGYYQSGVAPHYSRDDENNTVTDHITGLMWADDEKVTKQWLTDENYNDCKDNGNNCENTNSDPADPDDDTAAEYCEALSLGGFNDWRVPTIDELMNIADKSKRYPAIIDSTFKNVVYDGYWSSTTVVGDEYDAWNNGNDGWDGKFGSYYVRCVRE